ncbi:2-dehydropantoate 2-reductase [Ascidiimonas aurantiaca]|uniref:ketopantoate reductase family protein n=1 Tax=Ascidiimonas aurantiaca TaxID=1685432 RepID=UPI0030EBC7DB
MRIVVYGIGGVGGYFGGKLAKSGVHITFIARGEHLHAITTSGLQVRSIYGDFIAYPDKVTANIAEVQSPDLILLAVKTWQLEEVARSIQPHLEDHTLVMPLQNAVNNIEKLQSILPPNQILGGLCRIISFVEGPGRIWHKAFHPQILFGEVNNEKTKRIAEVQKAFNTAGIDNKIPDNIQLAIWQKFLFIATLSGLGALTRAEIGVMRSTPQVRELMLQVAGEICLLARAKGIGLNEQDVARVMATIDKQDPHTTASMQRDLMEGRPSELEDFNGYIVKEASRWKVPVPVNQFIYSCLLPMELKARQPNP